MTSLPKQNDSVQEIIQEDAKNRSAKIFERNNLEDFFDQWPHYPWAKLLRTIISSFNPYFLTQVFTTSELNYIFDTIRNNTSPGNWDMKYPRMVAQKLLPLTKYGLKKTFVTTFSKLVTYTVLFR